jgi:hypothetical protein
MRVRNFDPPIVLRSICAILGPTLVVFTLIFMRVYFFKKCRDQEKEQERRLGEEYGECFDKMIYEDEMKDLIAMESEEGQSVEGALARDLG